jgi:hypothetical protein
VIYGVKSSRQFQVIFQDNIHYLGYSLEWFN